MQKHLVNSIMNKKTIFITGASGFIGKYFIKNFTNSYSFTEYKKNDLFNIDQNIVLHFAGKAHDLKKNVNIKEYYKVNTELTKIVFDSFVNSKAKVFIFLSSVKAAADSIEGELTERFPPNPITHYGKSKLFAENYILSKIIPRGKRVYILRPCMIHGPGNKGNLNFLYKFVSKGLPWPLGKFENKRSFCSIDNLCFIIKEIIENNQIPSGVYNISDDVPLSTNEIIILISNSLGKKLYILKIPQFIIKLLFLIGDKLRMPFNTERLTKLTENYVVCNEKIKKNINKTLPINSKEGFLKTIYSFKKDN